jgi:hypothetical protein
VSERASVFVQAVYGKQIRRTQTVAGSSAARFDKEIHFVWTEKDATHVFHNNDLIISLKQVLSRRKYSHTSPVRTMDRQATHRLHQTAFPVFRAQSGPAAGAHWHRMATQDEGEGDGVLIGTVSIKVGDIAKLKPGEKNPPMWSRLAMSNKLAGAAEVLLQLQLNSHVGLGRGSSAASVLKPTLAKQPTLPLTKPAEGEEEAAGPPDETLGFAEEEIGLFEPVRRTFGKAY